MKGSVEMGVNIPVLFGFYAILSSLFKISLSLFLIYFVVSVMKFMKMKIKLDEQRIAQTNWFIQLYKNTNEKP